jgi:hypothetical protein
MQDGCWLNDEAINFYMHLLQVGPTRMRGSTLDSCQSTSKTYDAPHVPRQETDTTATLSKAPRACRAHTSSTRSSTPS